jgi:hypothetical protein
MQYRYDHFSSPLMATDLHCLRALLKRQLYKRLQSIEQSGRKNHLIAKSAYHGKLYASEVSKSNYTPRCEVLLARIPRKNPSDEQA